MTIWACLGLRITSRDGVSERVVAFGRGDGTQNMRGGRLGLRFEDGGVQIRKMWG